MSTREFEEIVKELESKIKEKEEYVKELEKSKEENKELIKKNDEITQEVHKLEKEVQLIEKFQEENYSPLIEKMFKKPQEELEKHILVQSNNSVKKSMFIALVSIFITIGVSLLMLDASTDENNKLFQKLEQIPQENSKQLDNLKQKIIKVNKDINKENIKIFKELHKNIDQMIKQNVKQQLKSIELNVNSITNDINSKNKIKKEKDKNINLVIEHIDVNAQHYNIYDNNEALFYKLYLLTNVAPLKYEIYIDAYKNRGLSLEKVFMYDREMLKLYNNWISKLQNYNAKYVDLHHRTYGSFKGEKDLFNYDGWHMSDEKMTKTTLINILKTRVNKIQQQLSLNNYKR